MHAVGDVADGNRVFRLARDRGRSTSRATLRRAARRRHWRAARACRPSTVMQNCFVLDCRDSRAPVPSACRCDSPSASRSGPRCSSIRSGVEPVVARGHRRVGGEDDFARHARHGLVEAEPFLLHAAANRFEHGESAVPFVQVQHAGRDAHGLQRAEAADAQQQFLADADAPVAAVQTRGQFAVFRSIAFDVRVEQQQIAAAHLHAPDLGADGAAAGLDLDGDRLAVGADGRLHRQLVDVGLQDILPAASRLRSSRCRKYPWP